MLLGTCPGRPQSKEDVLLRQQTSEAAHAVQSDYTREHSEATQALLKGFVGDIVKGVASSRGLPEAEVAVHLQLR